MNSLCLRRLLAGQGGIAEGSESLEGGGTFLQFRGRLGLPVEQSHLPHE